MCELDVNRSGYGPVAGNCEHGNEPSGSIRGGAAQWLSPSQEGLCPM
jgi:hypothetical protein